MVGWSGGGGDGAVGDGEECQFERGGSGLQPREFDAVLAGTPEGISASQPATIRFTLPDGAPPLPRVPGVRVEHPAPQVQLSTFALQPTLAQLLTWANEHGLELSDLQARAASLEQAFLAVADGALPTAA